MLDILRWFEWIKNSNLVALITNRIEFEKYNFLTLDVNILSKIENIFQEQKNTTLKIFTWNKDFEEILFIFYLDSKKDLTLFLGENIWLIQNKITFEYSKDNILLDSIILWKYDFSTYKSEKKDLEINIVCDENNEYFLRERLSTLNNITQARDLVNTPSNDKTCDK